MNRLSFLGLIGLFSFCFSGLLFGKEKEINILACGGKGDGVTLNTVVIQSAIDSISLHGGGKLIFPEGRFLSGSIVLKSGVTLWLLKNAVLLGSTNPSHYRSLNHRKALVLSEKQVHIAIVGSGTIDGQGRKLALNVDSLYYVGQLDPKYYNLNRKRPTEFMRPYNIEMVECKDVLIKGITIKDASCWVQEYDHCENLVMDSIRVVSDAYWNNDGIDVSDSKNVRITNCFVNAADDGICLKSSDPKSCNDSIYIANCTIRSSANAIKFGTSSVGGFRNVVIENIKVYDTFRSAIALEAVDGGVLENITIRNVVATNTGNAFFIRLGHRNKDERISTVRNVSITNLKAEIPFDRPDKNYDLRGPDLPFFHNPFPCSVTGIPGHDVENITLENIEIRFPGRGNDGLACIPIYRLKDVPEQETDYPEFSMFGELPAWALYVRHAQNVTMKKIHFSYEADDFRPACVFDDVKGLHLQQLLIPSALRFPVVVLNKVSDYKMNNLELVKDSKVAIRIQ